MIKLLDDINQCYGCTACKSICPKQAIRMIPNKEGFMYPVVDESVCVECGLCRKACPINCDINIDRLPETLVYAVKHKSGEIRMFSSSGGAYTAISDIVLNSDNINGRICYGASFNKDFKVHHVGAITSNERDKFRGSKYIQSDLGDAFINIKKDLINGRTLLFTGTPCQSAGLIKFLEIAKVNTEKLIINDIVCHGTPSPKLWNDYVNFLENKYKRKLKSYSFRFKGNGWKNYPVRVEFQDGKIKIDSTDIRVFSKLFFTLFGQRPSCYKCQFTNLCRPSDITIGDFWGIEKCLPQFEDSKGVSLMLVNTYKGKKIFEKIKECCYFNQSNLKQPNKKPFNREQFWENYNKFGFIYVAKKYGGYNVRGKIKNQVRMLLKQIGILECIKRVSIK